ncbi:hypothetical protein BKA81DRAFT_346526 [Phyllosticta paracitricarpa]
MAHTHSYINPLTTTTTAAAAAAAAARPALTQTLTQTQAHPCRVRQPVHPSTRPPTYLPKTAKAERPQPFGANRVQRLRSGSAHKVGDAAGGSPGNRRAIFRGPPPSQSNTR